MKFWLTKKGALICFLIGIFPFFEMAFLLIIKDPRFLDHSLESNEMYLFEKIALLLSVFTVFFCICSSFFNALKFNKKSRAFLSLVWPLSFYFLYKYGVQYQKGKNEV